MSPSSSRFEKTATRLSNGDARAFSRESPEVRVKAGRQHGRRGWMLALAALFALFASRSSLAESNTVPAAIEAELIAKLARYDRNFAARAGNNARVLLVVNPASAKSQLSAEEMKSALSRIDRIGALPHQESIVLYKGANALAERCRNDRIAIVYLTPGLDEEVPEIRAALSTLNILSVAAVADYVRRGVIMGFELEAGAPKILLNLTQARRQHVDFPSDVLRLMKVLR